MLYAASRRALLAAPAGPPVLYDFVKGIYKGPQLSITRASSKYVDDLAGSWKQVPANTLAVSDKGLLSEGQQVNTIRNNGLAGASAGSPGVLPSTVAVAAPAGLTRTVAIEVVNGLKYLRLRFQGTATSSASLSFQWETQLALAPAAQNQLWTASTFFQWLSVGGLSGAGNLLIEVWAFDSNSAFISTGQASTTGTLAPAVQASPVRLYTNRTLPDVNTAFVRQNIRTGANIASGTVCDFEFRIGMGQTERWDTGVNPAGGPSSPIETNGAVGTRAADIVSAVGIPTSPNGLDVSLAVLAQASLPAYAQFGIYAELTNSPATPGNRVHLRNNSNATQLIFISNRNDAQSGSFPSVILGTAGPVFAAAAALNVSSGDTTIFLNGAQPATVSVNDRPPSGPLSTLFIGHTNGVQPAFAYFKKLEVYPGIRLPNSDLQRLSTL